MSNLVSIDESLGYVNGDRFLLSVLISKRARELNNGSPSVIISDNKNTVVALQEAGMGLLDIKTLASSLSKELKTPGILPPQSNKFKNDIDLDKKEDKGSFFDDIEYIVDKAKVVKIQNKSNRCLYIDIDKALKAGVDLEGFIGVQEKDTSDSIFEEVEAA